MTWKAQLQSKKIFKNNSFFRKIRMEVQESKQSQWEEIMKILQTKGPLKIPQSLDADYLIRKMKKEELDQQYL